MPERGDEFRRDDARERTREDLERLRRREPGGGFWRSLGLVGSVGWPIVLFAAGGALLGHALDMRWHTGIRIALLLLTLGTVIGSWAAFRALRGNGP